MQKQISNQGIYILELFSPTTIRLNHKKFADKTLPKGYLFYVGSAQKNFIKRIERHITKNKKLHWHIDYLTTRSEIKLERIFIFPNATKENECKLVSNLANIFHLEYPLIGFGNSDCNNCKSHLLFSKVKINYNHLCSLYHSTVLFIPSESDILWE